MRTNEVTVLLGDNWFAKCSAKQAQAVVDHRMSRESDDDVMLRRLQQGAAVRHVSFPS